LNFAQAAAWTAAQKADVVCDLKKADGDGLEMTARFDHAVLRALGFEMIFRFAKGDSGPLSEMAHHFGRKIVMPVEPGPDRRPTEGEFLERADGGFGATFPVAHLLGVTAEFLPQPNRSRVHQMGAADLYHVVEFGRFSRERVA
jgi:hypothetical protein